MPRHPLTAGSQHSEHHNSRSFATARTRPARALVPAFLLAATACNAADPSTQATAGTSSQAAPAATTTETTTPPRTAAGTTAPYTASAGLSAPAPTAGTTESAAAAGNAANSGSTTATPAPTSGASSTPHAAPGTAGSSSHAAGQSSTAGTSAPAAGSGAGANTATFTRVWREVLSRKGCTGEYCHGAGQGALKLSNPSEAYQNLVGVMAAGAACASTAMLRVKPRDPSASLLLDKLSHEKPACGDPMPIGTKFEPSCVSTNPPVCNTRAEIALVRAWIEAGAEND